MASGTAPGYYTGKADEFREAYRTAKNLNEAGSANSSEADCYATYKALRDAYATGISMIMPTDGAVYRIRNYVKGAANEYHDLANTNGAISFPTSIVERGMENATLWVCSVENGKYKFVSALGNATLDWESTRVSERAFGFGLSSGVTKGALCLKNGTTNLAMTNEAHGSGLAFNHSSNNGTTDGTNFNSQWSTDWYLVPVDDADVAFNRTMPAGHHWGTLYLPYAVEVPENITAYYATTVDKEKKVIDLYNVGEVIPAYTAVLINRVDDGMTETFSFKQTAEKGNTVAGDVFEGRIMETYLGEENYNYYLLLNASKDEAFYWVAKEYNNGTNIKCEANKAFFALEAGSVNPAALSFRYGGDTTEIDEVIGESGEVKTIYDLQGRKLSEITKPGVYIVGGKKVFVK